MKNLAEITPITTAGAGEMTPDRNIHQVTLEIKTLHRQAQGIVLSYAVEIGRRLVEAKSMVEHGGWGDYLKNEVEFSQSTANNFMKLFEEYGSRQTGLFGAEVNSQAFGNLTYSKALALLAVPADEREDFVEEHSIDEMSTRELSEAIRERDEFKAKLIDETARADQEAVYYAEAQQLFEAEADVRVRAEKDLQAAVSEKAELEREIAELKARPIEVAVQEPDKKTIKEAVDKAVEKKEKELNRKLEEAEKNRAEAEERLTVAREAASAAEATAERLKKEAAMADPVTTQFRTLFDEAQSLLNKLCGLLTQASPETGEKLRGAMEAMLNAYGEKLQGE